MKNITYMNINSNNSRIRGFDDLMIRLFEYSRIKRIVHYPLSIVHYSLLILLFLLPLGKAWGQTLAEYTVTTGTQTYSSIASSSNLLSSVTGDAGYQTISLPFDFPFGETSFLAGTNVTVRADGYLYFGTYAPGHTCNAAWTTTSYQVIAPFLNYDGKITANGATSGAYSTTQTIGGVQTLVIEFKGLQCYYSDYGNYNFQVRLHANGNISTVYGSSTLTTNSNAKHNFFLVNGTDKVCLVGSYASPTPGAPSTLPNFTTGPSSGTVITYVRSGGNDCEDFENVSGASTGYSAAGSLPSGWDWIYNGVVNSSSAYAAHVHNGASYSGTGTGTYALSGYYLGFYATGNNGISYAIMPASAANEAANHISFKYNFESAGYGKLTYGVISGIDDDTYQVLGTISNPGTNPGHIDIDLATAATSGKRIAFCWECLNASWYTCGIDDLCVTTASVTPAYTVTAVAETGIASAYVAAGTSFSGTATSVTVNAGGSATFKATVSDGYTFDGWYNGSTRVSTNLQYTVNNINSNLTLIAKANLVNYAITSSVASTCGMNQSFTISVSPSASSYQWQFKQPSDVTWTTCNASGSGAAPCHNGYTDGTSQTITINSFADNVDVQWRCRVNGSTYTDPVTIHYHSLPTITFPVSSPYSSCGSVDIAPTIGNTNCGNVSWVWSGDGSGSGTGTSVNTYNVSTSGTYTFTVNDSYLQQYDLIVQNGVPAIVVVAPTVSATGKAVPIGTGGIGSNTSAGNIAYNAATNLQRAIVVNGGERYNSGSREGYVIPIQSCSATASIDVTIDVPPTLTHISGSTSQDACVDNAIENIVYHYTPADANVSVSGLPSGVNYTANSGVLTISGSPTVSATYSYSVTVSSGSCPSLTPLTGTIKVANKPNVSVNSPQVCKGSSVTLQASGATSYTWTPTTYLSSGTGSSVSFSSASSSVVAGNSYTVTVTGTSGNCQNSAVATVTVNALPNVTVNSPKVCKGTAASLTASGATTYTWAPSTNLSATTGASVSYSSSVNAGTYTVTVTGTTNNCTGAATATVRVEDKVTPTFTAPGPYCVGATPASLPSCTTVDPVSGSVITGSWNPSTISTSSSGTNTYNFNVTSGQCANNGSVVVRVNDKVTPTFTAPGPYCVGATPASLPSCTTVDPVSGSVITGSWNPSTISTSSSGTNTYNFNVTSGQCANNGSVVVTVNDKVTPTFTAPGPYCVGATPAFLPSCTTVDPVSGSVITGSWNPSTISTSSSGTNTYNFNVTSGQCANNGSVVVTVNDKVTPTFTAPGPYCVGATPASLPSCTTVDPVSGSVITGSWNPSTISTSSSGTNTYSFNVTSGQCANNGSVVVRVNDKVTPTFTAPGPYCVGATPASLPSCTTVDPVSGSVITGSWNPSTISTSSSGTNTYNFNVTSGQCANNSSVVVTVNDKVTPTFTAPGPYCVGATPASLPTSTAIDPITGNAITGHWNPSSINTTTASSSGTPYSFVVDGGQCADNGSVSVVVNPLPTPSISGETSPCSGESTTLDAGSGYASYLWYDGTTEQTISPTPSAPTDYSVTVYDGNTCSASTSVTVTPINCCDISVSDIAYTDPTCYGGNNGTATVTVDGGTAPFTYLWSDGETTTSNVRDDLLAGAYSVTVRDANGCESGHETTNECFRITDILYNSCDFTAEGFNEMVTLLIGPNDLDAGAMEINWSTSELSFTGFCENASIVSGINASITGGGRVIAPTGGILPANSEVLIVTSTRFDYTHFDFSGLDHDVYILFQCNTTIETGHFGNSTNTTRNFSISFGSSSCSDAVSYRPPTTEEGNAVHYNADGTVDYYNNGCQAPVFYNEIVLNDPEEITLSYSSISGYQNVDLGGISPVTNCTGTATYSSTDLPDGLALDPSTGVITGTPEHQEDGSFSVTMTCDGCEAHYTVDYHFDEEPDYQGCVIEEDFSEITTGGNTATSGTNGPLGTELTPNFISDFPTTSRAYAAGGVVKLGSSSNSGFIQTAPLNLSVPFYVEFDVKGWTSVEGNIIVTVSGGETQTVSYTATIGSDFETKRINFNAATSTSTVKIETSTKRAFIDNVKVCYPDPCSVEARQVAGLCEGKIVIEAEGSGGMGDFSYAWDHGAGNDYQYAGAISGTTYTVTASDEFGCMATATVTPVQTGKPIVTPNYSPITCHEGATDIVLDVTGGAGEPYTYHWGESTSTTNTVEDVSAGTYHVTVSDANCSSESTISVTEPDAITFDVTTAPQVCNTPGSATVSNEQGGNGTYSYEWSNSSTDASVELTSGNYSVTVRDGNDCSASAAVTVGSSSTSVSFSATPSNPTCSYQTGSIVVNNFVGASPYTVAWDGGSVDNITGSYTITNLGTGNYAVTVTDADGCGYTHTGLSIEIPDALTLNISTTDAICNNRSMTLTATAGFSTYAWGHGSATEGTQGTGANANTYTVTITNGGTYSVMATAANGCSVDATLAVTVNPTPEAGASIVGDDEVCIGEDAELTATPVGSGYTYHWSTGEETATISIHPTAQMTYTVTVFQGDCSDEESITVGTCNCGLTANAEQIAGFCEDKIIIRATGSDGSGDYSYLWNNNSTGDEIVNAENNTTYSVTITDNSTNCTASASVTTSQTGYPSISYEYSPIACNGGTTDIELTVTGGAGTPYTYHWGESTSTTNTIEDVTAGTYTVTVSDEHSCATSTSIQVTQPDAITFDVATTPQICTTPGSATVEIANSGDYSYIWRNSANEVVGTNSNVLSDVNAGTYSVTITSTATGCTATGTGTIGSSSTTVSFSASASSPTCSYETGSISVTNIQGTAPYTIAWNGGSADNIAEDHYTIAGLGTDDYTVIVTDADGCGSSQAGLAIDVPAEISFTLTSTAQVCTTPGTLTVEIANSDDYTYAWHNSSDETVGDGTNVLTASAGTYSVIVTAPNGCTAESGATIGSSSTTVSFSASASSPTCSYETGSISVTNIQGTAPYTIAWNSGSADNIADDHYTIAGLGTDDYTVIVTDADGCGSSQAGLAIDVPAEISFTLTSTAQVCSTPGTLTVEISNSDDYTYAWHNSSDEAVGDGTSVLTANAGTYSVIVTAPNGCTAESGATIGSSSTTVSFSASESSPTCSYETGSIAVTNIQGTAPYTIAWNSGSADNIAEDHYTITGLGTDDYTVIVTDSDGCGSSQAGLEIEVPAEISFTLASSAQVCTTPGTLTVEISNSDDYTYAWHNSSDETVGDGTSVLTANAGTYSVIVTAPNGCTAESGATIGSSSTTVSFSASESSPTCSYETGSIAVTNIQGTAPYTIAWNGGSADNITDDHYTIAGLGSDDYTVIVTDADGCGSTEAGLVIEIPIEITYSVSTVEQVCSTPGSITLENVSGGAGGYSYQWSNSANEAVGNGTNVLSGVNAGVYNVTVIDANGCEKTDAITLGGTGGTVSFSLAAQELLCNGDGSGSIDVENITGRSPYSIAWTSTVANGSENAVVSSSYEISDLPAGNYTIIVTDADECSSTLTTIVEEPALLRATAELTAPIMCHGDKFGVTVIVNGGTLADGHEYSYSWSNHANTQSQNGLEEYIPYIVTVTDDNNCNATSSVDVVEPSAVQILISADEILCHGQTTTITVSGLGGTGTYTGTGEYENISASTTLYSYTIYDENNCSASGDILVEEPEALSVIFDNIVAHTCETLGSVDMSISGGIGLISYSWDAGSVNTYTSATTISLTSGPHNVSVTDGNGCGYSQTVDIPNGSSMTVDVTSNNRVICNGTPTGSFEVSFTNGTSPYTIMWTNGSLTETAASHVFSRLAAGVYGVTVVDANGCSDNTSVRIEEPQPLEASAIVASTINCHNDAFDIYASATGGNGGYSYMWDGSVAGQSRIGLTVYTTYTVEVSDAQGCIATASVTPINPQQVEITGIECNPIQCHDGTTIVNANAMGGTGVLTYTWSTENVPGVNSQQITAPAGTYTLVVSDGNGCSATTTHVIQNPDEISVQLTGTTNQYCTTLGEARLSVTGGTGTLTYSWDGITNNSVVGNTVVSLLAAGSYTLTVTDVNGCSATQDVRINAAADMSVEVEQPVSVLCFNDRNGSFVINMEDGTAPYIIMWNSGTLTETNDYHTFDNLAAGVYNVTVTDAHNCVATISAEVETPRALEASSSAGQILCHGGMAEVIVSATGGTLPYQNTGTFNLVAGEYDYLVTDGNGCTSSTHVSLVEPSQINVDAVSANALCNGGTGSSTLIISGGSSPYEVVWQDNSTGESNTHIPVNVNFGYVVTDANGCRKDGTVWVGEPAPISLELIANDVSCNGFADGAVSISTISGGVPPYSYLWDNGYTGNNLTGLDAGTYSLLATDANGCTASSTILVNQPEPLSVGIVTSNVECGVSQGSAFANVNGGTSPYSYVWANGYYSESLAGITSGTYSLTVTDANGCTAIASSQVSVMGMISATISEVNPISCFGMNDATLTAITEYAQAPVNYQWNSGQSGATVYGVASGLYVVSVTDAWGCEGVASYLVQSPSAIEMSSFVTNANCQNTHEGAISLNVNGGHAPYSYLWSTGSTEQNLSGLSSGDYHVMVTDSTGCTLQRDFTISAPSSIVINTEVTDVGCYGRRDGRIEISAEGGVEPYDFGFVSGNSTTHGRTVYDRLGPGHYKVVVSDANGCGESVSVYVSQPERLGAVAFESMPSCKDMNDGSIEIVTAGGTSPYTYTMDSYTIDSAVFAGLRAGKYEIVVTDANGCSTTISDINVPESKLDCIRIPNVFTPNGDGVNDEWIIEHIEMFPNAHIYVYNRWGQLLYHERGNGQRWDGRYRGHFVPSGVYMYIIDLESVEEKYEGTVTILY